MPVLTKVTKAVLEAMAVLFPAHKPPGRYPGMYWQDAPGRFTASITAHEVNNDGKVIHNHLTIKTARADRAKNLDRSRFHVTHGHEIAQVQITDYAELVTYKPPIFRAKDNQYYRLDMAKLVAIGAAEKVDRSHIQFTE